MLSFYLHLNYILFNHTRFRLKFLSRCQNQVNIQSIEHYDIFETCILRSSFDFPQRTQRSQILQSSLHRHGHKGPGSGRQVLVDWQTSTHPTPWQMNKYLDRAVHSRRPLGGHSYKEGGRLNNKKTLPSVLYFRFGVCVGIVIIYVPPLLSLGPIRNNCECAYDFDEYFLCARWSAIVMRYNMILLFDMSILNGFFAMLTDI